MKTPKKTYLLWLGVAAVIVLIFFFLSGKPKTEEGMILFFGESCPHCQNVERYIADNNIREKIKFQELEVYSNPENAQVLAAKARSCGLDTRNGLGVPFFYDGQDCYLGEEEIVSFFQERLGSAATGNEENNK
jgi:glutaredoxin